MGVVNVSTGGWKPIEFDEKAFNTAPQKVARDMSQDLRKRASSMFGDGPYAQGWTSGTRDGVEGLVLNSGRDRSLAHLLESGHAVKNKFGGPYGFVKGKPHIEPSFKEHKKIFDKMLDEALDNSLK